jgi:hypothetical protein
MSTIPADPHESAYALFDRWQAHWQRASHPRVIGAEPAAAAAPPTQEAGTSPIPTSPAAAAPSPRRSPEAADSGLLVLRALTEEAVRMTDPWGAPTELHGHVTAPGSAATSPGTERQVGGAILRFPSRAVPSAKRLAALEQHAEPPRTIVFSARAGRRPVLTAGAVVGAALTGSWVLVAMLLPTSTTLGVAAVMAVVTGLLWTARMRASGTAVTIEDGVLRIVRGQSRHQFPLTGVHPPIDVIGDPGDRSWKVLIQRRGLRPYVIDRSMVDPYELTDAVRRFRPRA